MIVYSFMHFVHILNGDELANSHSVKFSECSTYWRKKAWHDLYIGFGFDDGVVLGALLDDSSKLSLSDIVNAKAQTSAKKENLGWCIISISLWKYNCQMT